MDTRVSCRALADLLALCDARGIELSDLTDGLTVDLATLRTRSAWVEWSEVATVVERISDRVGGPQAYAELVAGFLDHPDARLTRRFFSIASSPTRNYKLVFLWAAPLVYPFMTSRVETTPDGRIHISHSFPTSVPGSLPFMTSAVEMARRLPRIHGLPDAVVEAEVTPWSVSILARLPEQVSWLGRFRRWLRFIRDAPMFIEEVIEQQEQLHRSHAELQRALELAQERERALSEEVEARKLAQEELASRNELLLHSQRMESIGRLAGGVAHDFNNLLTVISGHAAYLQRLSPEGEVRSGVDEILGAADRAAALTRQLLTFARRQPAERHVHQLNDLLRDIDGLLTRVLHGHSIQIRHAEEPLFILCDPVQLEQVLVNLAVNASDAMPGGGTFTLEVARVEKGGVPIARLTVTDTGVGMPQDVAEHVFEPFFTTKGELGNGLGLATVYGIVTEAGGTIELVSEVGIGTQFVIDWPLGEGSQPHHPLPKPRPQPAANATVLLLEDEPAIARLIQQELQARGHAVHLAARAEEARAIVDGHPIDLVISDVMLADERGPDVVASLPGAASRKALFITGYAEPERLGTVGDAPVLSKPFRMSTLGDEVDLLLSTG